MKIFRYTVVSSIFYPALLGVLEYTVSSKIVAEDLYEFMTYGKNGLLMTLLVLHVCVILVVVIHECMSISEQ